MKDENAKRIIQTVCIDYVSAMNDKYIDMQVAEARRQGQSFIGLSYHAYNFLIIYTRKQKINTLSWKLKWDVEKQESVYAKYQSSAYNRMINNMATTYMNNVKKIASKLHVDFDYLLGNSIENLLLCYNNKDLNGYRYPRWYQEVGGWS